MGKAADYSNESERAEVMRKSYLKLYQRDDGHRIVTHEIVDGEVLYQHWPPGVEVQGFGNLYRCRESVFKELLMAGEWTEQPVQP